MLAFLVVPFITPSQVHAASGEYLMYLPTPVEGGKLPQNEEGIVVKRIIIRRGDTLSALSREYSGYGYYYPQILLFNKIPNPDLIYAGRNLLVPLSPAGGKAESGRGDILGKKSKKSRGRAHTYLHAKSSVKMKAPGASERRLYRKAFTLFYKGKYQDAVAVFSRFLKKYPHSSLAPDATLHRADCFLRLSTQNKSEWRTH